MARVRRTAGLLLAALSGLLVPGAAGAQSGDMRENKGAPAADLVARALGVDPERLASIDAEKATRAKDIGNEVVCLCGDCPKRTITDCECWWAQPNKRIIQAAVAKGLSREEIITAYRQAYGDQVLAMIPNEGFAQTAWMLPYAFGAVGLLVVFAIGFRYMRKARKDRAPEAAPEALAPRSDPARAELSRELEEMD